MLAEVLCDGVPCVLVHSGLYGVDEFLTKVELIKLIARITDDDASPAKQEMEDLWARAFQHELDHLDGILFIDKISPMSKRLISKKLDQLKKMSAEQ